MLRVFSPLYEKQICACDMFHSPDLYYAPKSNAPRAAMLPGGHPHPQWRRHHPRPTTPGRHDNFGWAEAIATGSCPNSSSNASSLGISAASNLPGITNSALGLLTFAPGRAAANASDRCLCGCRTAQPDKTGLLHDGPPRRRKWLSRLADSAQNQSRDSESQSPAVYRCPCSPFWPLAFHPTW